MMGGRIQLMSGGRRAGRTSNGGKPTRGARGCCHLGRGCEGAGKVDEAFGGNGAWGGDWETSNKGVAMWAGLASTGTDRESSGVAQVRFTICVVKSLVRAMF